jgi:hypothetical protein
MPLRPLCIAFALALALALALAPAAVPAGPAPTTPAADAPTKPATLPLQATQGTELSAKDERDVRAVLTRYLEAMKHKRWREAGELVERKSFLASADAMIKGVSTDSTQELAAMRKMFAVQSRAQFDRLPTAELFERMMRYMEELNPDASNVLADAELELLAARQFNDRVHIAYQLTIPGDDPAAPPITHVTAEQMARVDGKWKILFRLDK